MDVYYALERQSFFDERVSLVVPRIFERMPVARIKAHYGALMPFSVALGDPGDTAGMLMFCYEHGTGVLELDVVRNIMLAQVANLPRLQLVDHGPREINGREMFYCEVATEHEEPSERTHEFMAATSLQDSVFAVRFGTRLGASEWEAIAMLIIGSIEAAS